MGCAGTKHQSNIADFSQSGSTLEAMTLDKLTLKRYNSEFKGGSLTKKEIYKQMSQRKLNSDIKFEIQFHSSVPIEEHDLTFIISYSTYEHTWIESSKS